MTVVFGVLLVVAVMLVGLSRLKDLPALADPPVVEPRNVKVRRLHPANELSDEAVDRLLKAMEETP